MDQLTNFCSGDGRRLIFFLHCEQVFVCDIFQWHRDPSLLLSDFHKFWYSINIRCVEKNSSDYSSWSVIKYLDKQNEIRCE